jgi:hypothetical protein
MKEKLKKKDQICFQIPYPIIFVAKEPFKEYDL